MHLWHQQEAVNKSHRRPLHRAHVPRAACFAESKTDWLQGRRLSIRSIVERLKEDHMGRSTCALGTPASPINGNLLVGFLLPQIGQARDPKCWSTRILPSLSCLPDFPIVFRRGAEFHHSWVSTPTRLNRRLRVFTILPM